MEARGSVRGTLASLALGLAALVACNSTYGTAAVGLGATVLATGVNRTLTGSCWGNCAKGFYCDHESGLCERGECDPSCRESDYCVKESNGHFRCVAPAGTYAFGKTTPPATEDASSADAGAPLAPFADGGVSPDSESDAAGPIADAGTLDVPPIADAGADAAPPLE